MCREVSRPSACLQLALIALALLAISCARREAQKRFAITSVYPRCIPSSRPTRITISGNGFDTTDRVLFGRLPGSNIALSNRKQLLVDAPASGEGSVQVTVITPDGERRTVVNAITYRPPQTFDPNGDCLVSAADVFYLSQYLKHAGPPPILSGDANGDGVLDQRDIDFLIKHLYAEGPSPHQ